MNKENNKMPRETIASLKAKNAELEMQNNKYFDAWLKLDQERQKEVTESAQYKALKEHYELEQKNSKALRSMLTDARSKNNKYLDELNTLKRKMQAMQADPENQQTAYKELQTEHERLKTEYETVKTLCERTLEAYNAIQNDYKALQVELQQIRTQSHTEPHNARNAGRKPKFTNEQMEQVRKMAADGLSVRKIAAEMSCSIGLVCKILHSNKN